MNDQATCTRCGKAVTWDHGDLAWSDADTYNLICVEGEDEDGADDLGHVVISKLRVGGPGHAYDLFVEPVAPEKMGEDVAYYDETVGVAAENSIGCKPAITLRTFSGGDRFDLFVGGWRTNIYKTRVGALRRRDLEDAR